MRRISSQNLFTIEMNKAEVIMNKPIYLSLLVLDISKVTMYEYWYDYTESFIVHFNI